MAKPRPIDPELKARVDAVWEHGLVDDIEFAAPPPWRYVPVATNKRGWWSVFDRREDRFLDREELLAIPLQDLEAVLTELLN